MTPEQWQRVKVIFEEVSGRAPDEWPTLLEDACAGDQEVRNIAASMLRVWKAEGPSESPGHSSPNLRLGASFVPGTLLDGRYRIVNLVGQGGMGEVYRADDLKLGLPVALKFLPSDLDGHDGRLARFRDEARTALQVTHPNVCRIQDLGQLGDRYFISMEYVDGEDLAALLRRIGRLPRDKATSIACQLCAGLSAAHSQGIVHRDLKPANVMIDGRGHVRITDFGLAAFAREVKGGLEMASGTPAYMAPEQFVENVASIKSDIYSLGLVLYELFTGRRPFESSSPAAILQLKSESTPTPPSSLVPGLDPEVDRVILDCIQFDPDLRPATAAAISAALSGGNILAASLAAGEIPSPQMVAAAGPPGGLRRPAATLILIISAAGLALYAYGVGRASLIAQEGFEKPPAVLADRGRAIAESLGYKQIPGDVEYGFHSGRYMEYVLRNDQSPSRWRHLGRERPANLHFWYRESSHFMVANNISGVVQWLDPPLSVPGMILQEMDGQGRLRLFRAVPPRRIEARAPPTDPVDWSMLFDAAALDLTHFEESSPQWVPEVYCDTRKAWDGQYPGQMSPPLRVEACAYQGRPVYFELVFPWTRNEARTVEQSAFQTGLAIAEFIFQILVLVGGPLLARWNLRQGKGDKQGAFRLALFCFSLFMLAWLLRASHVLEPFGEIRLLTRQLAWAIYWCALLWLAYLALEPFVRRYWPAMMMSWNRVLAGRLRDPWVGRDILVGTAFGILLSLWLVLVDLVPGWLGWAPPQPYVGALEYLEGGRTALGQIFLWLAWSLQDVVYGFLIGVLLRMALGSTWRVIAAGVLIAPWIFFFPRPEYLLFGYATMAVYFSFYAIILTRFGLLAAAAAHFVHQKICWRWAFSLDLNAWYADRFLILLIAAAIALYGFWASMPRPHPARADYATASTP